VGIAGAVAIFGLEQLVPAGWPRAALASVAWLAFGLGAMVTAARAAETTPGRDRLPWVFVAIAVGAWTVGMVVRQRVPRGRLSRSPRPASTMPRT
jgi:hypothetical protein